MASTVRAKFKVNSYSTALDWRDKSKELRTINLSAVTDGSPEDKAFWESTPNGEIKIGVLNPAAWEHFVLGKTYYVDFTPAD